MGGGLVGLGPLMAESGQSVTSLQQMDEVVATRVPSPAGLEP
jgi:hypothetical protein